MGPILSADYHLFCYWGNDSSTVSLVQKSLIESFELLEIFRISWSESLVRENFSRLYSCPPSADTGKQEKASGPPYWAWVVRDSRPDYGLFRSNSGLTLRGNKKIRNVKNELRELTGHPRSFLVHSSLTPEEFWHDAQLLIPLNLLITALRSEYREGEFIALGDPVGAAGWESAAALFGFLNRTLKYSVLRPVETQRFVDHESGEVDILVEDMDELVSLANARVPSGGGPAWWREVRLGDNRVIFDVREVGDGDLDSRWQRRIIRNARLSKGGVFVPHEEDLLFSTLHHAVTEKNPEKYLTRILPLAKRLGVEIETSPDVQWKKLLGLLHGWLDTNRFQLSYHGRRYPAPHFTLYQEFGRSYFFRLIEANLMALRTAIRFYLLWLRFRCAPVWLKVPGGAKTLMRKGLSGAKNFSSRLLVPRASGPNKRAKK